MWSKLRETCYASPAQAGRREDNKMTKLGGKTPRYGKNKTYFNKPRKWLKRMIVRDQENVFLFEFGLIVPELSYRRYQNVYFDPIQAGVFCY